MIGRELVAGRSAVFGQVRGLVAILCVIALALAPGLHARPADAAASAPWTTWSFNWYDRASPGMWNDNIHLVNPGSATASGTVSLPNLQPLPFSVAPGSATYVAFPPGTIGGPLTVTATSPVIASQRVQYFRSFSEVAGLAPGDLQTAGWFPWYDLASPGMITDNLHVLNPDPAAVAAVTFRLGSQSATLTVNPGLERWLSFPPGTIGGPLAFTSTSPVYVSQRVQNPRSFNEIVALSGPATVLTSNWYDNASPGFQADNLHIVAPGASPSTVTVSLAGATVATVTVPAGGETHLSLAPSTIGGPVVLTATQPILATQRVDYFGSFQETAFKAPGSAVTDLWLPWYDDASPCLIGDNVHVTAATPTAASVTLTLPGQPTLTRGVSQGGEEYVSWPRPTMGGPVHLTSSAPVFVDHRVVVCPPPPHHLIVVNLALQRMSVFEDGNLIRESDVTTGRPALPTPPGSFRIFSRQSPIEFISPWPPGSPYYYDPAWANWGLEFLQGGYFLHDAPWRSWFGPGSNIGDGTHGCINVPTDVMAWLFGWAQIGDEVDVVSG